MSVRSRWSGQFAARADPAGMDGARLAKSGVRVPRSILEGPELRRSSSDPPVSRKKSWDASCGTHGTCDTPAQAEPREVASRKSPSEPRSWSALPRLALLRRRDRIRDGRRQSVGKTVGNGRRGGSGGGSDGIGGTRADRLRSHDGFRGGHAGDQAGAVHGRLSRSGRFPFR